MIVNVHEELKKVAQPLQCNRSAVLQMREKGLSAIHMVCGQADDKEVSEHARFRDAVLLNGYE
jgi:hypothetical protein